MVKLKHALSTVPSETATYDGVARRSLSESIKQPSKIFSSLVSPPADGHRLTVLEVGTALPETVDYFSRYKCRMHFLDLFSEPMLHTLHELTPKQKEEWFREVLVFPAGTRLDILLFWDFLCYLDDKALRAFNMALRPFLHAESRAHAFGVHHMAIKLGNRRYGIVDDSTFTVRPSQALQPETRPHTQVEMHDMMSCFDFKQGLLLPDGKLEILLKARPEAFSS